MAVPHSVCKFLLKGMENIAEVSFLWSYVLNVLRLFVYSFGQAASGSMLFQENCELRF